MLELSQVHFNFISYALNITILIWLRFKNLQEADEERERSGDRDPEREAVVECAPVDLVSEPCVRVRVAPRRDARRRGVREPHYWPADHNADYCECTYAHTKSISKMFECSLHLSAPELCNTHTCSCAKPTHLRLLQ